MQVVTCEPPQLFILEDQDIEVTVGVVIDVHTYRCQCVAQESRLSLYCLSMGHLVLCLVIPVPL